MYVLLNLACQNFIEDFFIYVHYGYWPAVFFTCDNFAWLWYQGDVGLMKWLWTCSLFYFMEGFKLYLVLILHWILGRIHLWNQLVPTFPWLGRFWLWFISLFVIGLLRLSISSWFSFGKLYVSRDLCILGYPICWHIVVHDSSLWSFFISEVVVVMSLSFLMLFLWIFSLFFFLV